jgi:protoporphyrinogen oxidase
MIKKKILIVGGGFRGILTANQLKENNSIDLIEKSSYIGGVLFSEKWNGFYLDKGVHIFDNTNNEDTKLIQKILKNKFRKISVKYGSRITDKTSDKVAVPDFTTLDIKIQRKIAQELFECTYLKQKSKNLHEYLINYTCKKIFCD